MIGITDQDKYERNFARGLSSVKYIKSGVYPMMDASMSSKWGTGRMIMRDVSYSLII